MGIKYIFNPTTGSLDAVSVETPAGADTEIQFNNAGAFGADSDLTWDDTSNPKVLGIGGDINLDDGGSFTTTLQTVTPTANRTISFPNATGTIGLVAGSSGQVVYNNAGAYAGLSTVTTDGTNVTLTGRLINSTNAAASAPASILTGTWFAGANNTSFPNLYVAPTAASVGTSWSTLGTGFGVNSIANFTGDLIHLLQNGTSRFRSTGLGRVLFGEGAATGPALTVTAPARLYSGTGTYTDSGTAASGTVTHGAMVSIDNPAIAATNATVTYTTASSFYIDGAPTNGTNVTITNSYSFFVNAGVSYFGGDIQIADTANVVLATGTGTQIGTATTQKLGFFGADPVVQQTELTDELTTITHTAPGTADFDIQNLSLTGYGFVTEDEGNTVLSVIANLQARVNELETKLVALGFLADTD
jgi:hypothetical protein